MSTATVVLTERLVRSDGTIEEPRWIASAGEMLFGVRNAPVDGHPRTGAVICVHNGGYNMSAHHNQVWARLCRQAAKDGFQALRLDIAGTGDSTGTDAQAPNPQSVDNVVAAADWLRNEGATRFVLVGTCRGAMIAMRAAARIEGVAGVFLCAPPLALMSPDHNGLAPWQAPDLRTAVSDALSVEVLKRVIDDAGYRRFLWERGSSRLVNSVKSAWAKRGGQAPAAGESEGRLGPLRGLIEREVPIKVYLGEQDEHYRQLQEVRSGVLGHLLDRSPTVDIEVAPGSVHRFINIEGQERFLASMADWTRSVLGSQTASLATD